MTAKNARTTDTSAEGGVSAQGARASANGTDGRSSKKSGSKGDSSSGISVFVVDDHPPIRRATCSTLEATIDLRVCGYASSMDDAIKKVENESPDVVVVDLSLPDGHGLDLVQELRDRHDDVRVVVFSMYDESIYAERALRAGASGYVMKTESLDDLIEAIRRAERGGVHLSRAMATKVLSSERGSGRMSFGIDELTGRERQVLEMIGRGESVEDIQDELDISRKTVETYRRRAKEKLGLESTSELVQYALQWAFYPDPHDSDSEETEQ